MAVPKTSMNDLDLMIKDRLCSFIEILLRVAVDTDDDNSFSMIIRQLQEEGIISEQEFADGLGVARSTVNRWTRGRNMPHFSLRSSIYAWIAERVKVYSRQS